MQQLVCKTQQYAWGKIGSTSKVAELASCQDKTLKIDEDSPYAELWMGTHVNGPSYIANTNTSLKEYIKQRELPYLFKVLSVNKCLSIQAHPDKDLAQQLHAERPHIYKDPNHKPEIAIALTPFQAMSGFRPMDQIASFLQQIPPFYNIIGQEHAQSFINIINNDQSTLDDKKKALKTLFTALMTVDTET